MLFTEDHSLSELIPEALIRAPPRQVSTTNTDSRRCSVPNSKSSHHGCLLPGQDRWDSEGCALPFPLQPFLFQAKQVGFDLLLSPSLPTGHRAVSRAHQWSPPHPRCCPSVITECALDVLAGWRLEITRGGPLSCCHLSFSPHPPTPMFSAVPCRQGLSE